MHVLYILLQMAVKVAYRLPVAGHLDVDISISTAAALETNLFIRFLMSVNPHPNE